MLSGIFFPRSTRKKRERCIRDFVADVNAGRLDRMAQFLTEDFEYVDVSGNRTVSRSEFLSMDTEFRRATGDPQITIGSIVHHDDEVLVKGHMGTGIKEVRGETFWRIFFDADRMCRAEVTRAEGQLTMPVFAARARAMRA